MKYLAMLGLLAVLASGCSRVGASRTAPGAATRDAASSKGAATADFPTTLAELSSLYGVPLAEKDLDGLVARSSAKQLCTRRGYPLGVALDAKTLHCTTDASFLTVPLSRLDALAAQYSGGRCRAERFDARACDVAAKEACQAASVPTGFTVDADLKSGVAIVACTHDSSVDATVARALARVRSFAVSFAELGANFGSPVDVSNLNYLGGYAAMHRFCAGTGAVMGVPAGTGEDGASAVVSCDPMAVTFSRAESDLDFYSRARVGLTCEPNNPNSAAWALGAWFLGNDLAPGSACLVLERNGGRILLGCTKAPGVRDAVAARLDYLKAQSLWTDRFLPSTLDPSFNTVANGITVHADPGTAGAVSGISFRDFQYVDSHDIGRLAQYALFDSSGGQDGNCNNPTQAGRWNPMNGTAGDPSPIEFLVNGGNVLAGRVRALNFLMPGQSAPSGCVSTIGLTDVRFTTRVEIGVEGVPNAIRFEALVHSDSARATWALQAPIVFGVRKLDTYLALDPATGTLTAISSPDDVLVPGGRTVPLMTTPNRQHVIGIFSAEAARGQYQGAYTRDGGNIVGSNLSFLVQGPPLPAGGYLWTRTYVVIGTLSEVVAGIARLYATVPASPNYGTPF